MRSIHRTASLVKLCALLTFVVVLSGCKATATIVFSGDRLVINPGDSVVLNWAVTPAAKTIVSSVSISPDIGDVSPDGTQSLKLQKTTTYHLVATIVDEKGQQSTASKDLRISVVDTKCAIDDDPVSPSDISLKVNGIGDFIPLCNGDVYIGNNKSNRIDLRNVFTGKLLKTYFLDGSPGEMEIDNNNSILYVAMPTEKHITKIDLKTDIIKQISLPHAALHLTMGENGSLLMGLAGIYSPLLYVLHPDESTTGGWELDGSLIRYVPQSKILLVGNEGISPARLTSMKFNGDGAPQMLESLGYAGSNGQDLQISPDGKHSVFVVGSGNFGGDYTIFDFNPESLQSVDASWNTGPYPSGAGFSLDNQWIAANNGSDMIVFDVSTHQELQRTPVNSCTYSMFKQAAFSRGGRYVFSQEICEADHSTEVLHIIKAPTKESTF